MSDSYENLEQVMDIYFRNKDLLKTAFTHKSYLNENKRDDLTHNERLEFLGDAVLELAATKYLYFKYPDQDEGKMTSFRSALVKGEHLAEVANELEIGKYLYLSNGEEKSGGREKSYILANSIESLIGAIYVDQGYEAAEKFIKKFILTKLESITSEGLHIDAKSKFQEISQDKENSTPYYKVISENGPDHDKNFTMGAYIDDTLIATGIGSSKQKAELKAAENALKTKDWN